MVVVWGRRRWMRVGCLVGRGRFETCPYVGLSVAGWCGGLTGAPRPRAYPCVRFAPRPLSLQRKGTVPRPPAAPVPLTRDPLSISACKETVAKLTSFRREPEPRGALGDAIPSRPLCPSDISPAQRGKPESSGAGRRGFAMVSRSGGNPNRLGPAVEVLQQSLQGEGRGE